jgi:hypothetical protein
MARLTHRWVNSTVSDAERGQRPISVDELAAGAGRRAYPLHAKVPGVALDPKSDHVVDAWIWNAWVDERLRLLLDPKPTK